MRKFFLALTLMISAALTAHPGSIFRDEDTGLVIEIPEGFKRSWNVSNTELGVELVTFHDTDLTSGKVLLIASTVRENLFLDGPSLTLTDVQRLLGPIFEDDDLEDIAIQWNAEEILLDQETSGIRLQVQLNLDEVGTFLGDIYLIEKGDHLNMIAAAQIGDEEFEEIESFARAVLKTLRFIEK